MLSKSNLISALVTAAWAYFGGWLLWGMVGDQMMDGHMLTEGLMRADDQIDMVHLIIGSLVVGFFFSGIYRKYGQSNYGASSGFLYGVLIGLLIGLGEGLVNYAVMNMTDITGVFINAVIYMVFYGIMGLLAGLIYQKTAPKVA
ncbi:MAG TPA: hypothetical protein PKW08_06370 [Flavobacteriaceae bacterium]|nr:hypothetical protein [Flavobacteriaceae bacterium]HPF11139.1 hypothetical protein [Flavobacteriaceae bacterium]HQU21193.1 hypothetical protein [Flavobacteriaceae bacterium]HQU65665.1 hypothetical protein [Flavobacteriaceae bacterium]HRW43740.1 hypothetical protein [Flavobacteriaceae bacterium]